MRTRRVGLIRVATTTFEEALIAGPARVGSRLFGRGRGLPALTLSDEWTQRAPDVLFGWPRLLEATSHDFTEFVVADNSDRRVRLPVARTLAVGEAPFDVLLAGFDFLASSIDGDGDALDTGLLADLLQRCLPADCSYSRANRLLVLSAAMAKFGASSAAIRAAATEIAASRFIEVHLGGNHLLRELRSAATLLALVESPQLRAWLEQFFVAARKQFLFDGGHVERSAFYHLQALSDVRAVLRLCSLRGLPVPPDVAAIEDRASRALKVVTTPDGRLLGFHDSWRVRSPVEPLSDDVSVIMEEFGLALLGKGPWRAYLDCGTSRPTFPLGHLHGSNLGLEIWRGTEPVVVDPGVSTYSPGVRRLCERSDEFHNGPRADSSRHLNAFGSFRTGRPAVGGLSRQLDAGSGASVTARTESAGAAEVEREVDVSPDGIRVTDRCDGGASILLMPGVADFEQVSGSCWRVGGSLLAFEGWSTAPETNVLGAGIRAFTDRSWASWTVTSA